MIYKIVVDKQSRTNPSSEKREYTIDIEELRVKGDIYDSLVITKDEDYVMRRLSLSELQVLSVLEEPIKQPLPDLNIELFEGDNYIYLLDMTGNKFYAEYIVKNDFTELYVTTNEMNSAINQSASQIELSVNQKLTGYSTTEEMNASINIKADEINQVVSKKVGNDEIISKINQSAEAVSINASKVNLSGYVTISNLSTSGKTTINGGNITTGTIDASKATITNINADNIKSGTITGRAISGGTITGTKITNGNNFVVDANGNMACNNGSFNGGTIQLNSSSSSYSNAKFKINSSDGSKAFISSRSIDLSGNSSSGIPSQINMYLEDSDPYISLSNFNLSSVTQIHSSGIDTPSLTQTSLEDKKKNFEKLQSGLDIIKNIDIYKYNLKSEDDNTKKHIGFVIGDKYKYSQEVTSDNNDGVDIYSFVAVCCKAIQEQQEQIEQQNNLIQSLIERIENLEKGANNEEN